MKLVNPANKRKYTVIVVGSGLAGGAGRRDARRARLQRHVLLLPGQPAPRALDRRAGRHQRREELPERRRQRLPPLLRHGQGRRLPRARGQRLPARRGQREHHRPVRRAGRAVRARVRRHCSPTAPSAARRSRARSTRAARPASSSCSAPTRRSSGRSALGKVKMYPRTEMLDLVVDRRPRARHRHARPGHRRDRVARRRRGGARDRRLRQRLLPLDQREGLQRHRDLARLQEGRRASPTPATRRSTRPASRSRGDYQSKLTLMRESLRNDGRVWVPKKKGDKRAARRRSPRPSATTTSSASTRASATWRRATSPRAPRRRCATRAAASGPAGCGVYLDFARRDQAPRRATRSASGTATCSRCTSASPARTRTRCRCASTRPSTTRWAGCGWTTT